MEAHHDEQELHYNMETPFLHIHNRNSRKTLKERFIYSFIHQYKDKHSEYCLLVN